MANRKRVTVSVRPSNPMGWREPEYFNNVKELQNRRGGTASDETKYGWQRNFTDREIIWLGAHRDVCICWSIWNHMSAVLYRWTENDKWKFLRFGWNGIVLAPNRRYCKVTDPSTWGRLEDEIKKNLK